MAATPKIKQKKSVTEWVRCLTEEGSSREDAVARLLSEIESGDATLTNSFTISRYA